MASLKSVEQASNMEIQVSVDAAVFSLKLIVQVEWKLGYDFYAVVLRQNFFFKKLQPLLIRPSTD